jgi:hypothetical protein
VGAEAAVPHADAVLRAEDRGEQRVAIAVEVEGGDAHPVDLGAAPERERVESRDGREPPPEALGEHALVPGHGIHAEVEQHAACRAERHDAHHIGRARLEPLGR